MMSIVLLLILILGCKTVQTETEYNIQKYSELVAPPERPVFDPVPKDDTALRVTGMYLIRSLSYATQLEQYYKGMEDHYWKIIETITE
jgi:hypothetical protein